MVREGISPALLWRFFFCLRGSLFFITGRVLVVVSLQLLAAVGFWCWSLCFGGSDSGLVFFAVGFWLLASDKTKPLTGCVLLF
jgi:hypothetical protein